MEVSTKQRQQQQAASISLQNGLRANLADFSVLSKLASNLCESCQALNRLIDQRGDQLVYARKYQNLAKLRGPIELLVVEKGPALKPLADLMLGLISYYSPLSYTGGGSHRSSSHSSRWPEFHRLIKDEVLYLSNIPAADSSEELSRAASHKALLSIRYDRNNIARPWDTGPELDLLTAVKQSRSRDSLRLLQGQVKIFMQMAVPTDPYHSHSSSEWNKAFDSFWSDLQQFWGRHNQDSLVEPLRSIITIANFTRESLRPECYQIQAIALELADSYLTLLQNYFTNRNVVGLNVVSQLKDIQTLVQNLEKDFGEHLGFRGDSFQEAKFAETFRIISQNSKKIQQEIYQTCGQGVAAEFAAHSLTGELRDKLIKQLAMIESSRTNIEDRSSLQVAYGANELDQLFCSQDSRLFVYFNSNKVLGFALVELHSPKLPIDFEPLLKSAVSERGNLPYAYLHLVVMEKKQGSAAYREIMKAIDDCAIRHDLVYTLGWCREDNAANIIHLKTGAELLPGSLRITEHGNTMSGRNLLRISFKRGLQKLLPIGEQQARRLRQQLAGSLKTPQPLAVTGKDTID